MRGCFETVDTVSLRVEVEKAKRKRQIQGRTKAVSRGRASGDKKGVVKEARKLRRKR